MKDTVTQIN